MADTFEAVMNGAEVANNVEGANGLERGVKDSWSFVGFCRLHGNPKPNSGKNKTTGESFENLAFQDKQTGKYTFVAFSSKLGKLSPQEMMDRKDELQVVKLNPDADGKEGGYILCKAGNLNLGEEIAIV